MDNNFIIMKIGAVSKNNRIYTPESIGAAISEGLHMIHSVNIADDIRDFIYRECGIVMLDINNFGILPPGQSSPPYQSMQCTLKDCISYINHFYFKKGE